VTEADIEALKQDNADYEVRARTNLKDWITQLWPDASEDTVSAAVQIMFDFNQARRMAYPGDVSEEGQQEYKKIINGLLGDVKEGVEVKYHDPDLGRGVT